MYMRRYSLAALVFMILIGGYIFTIITQENFSFEFFGVVFPQLPIALWVIAPLFILFIVTLLHFSFYSFLGNLELRKHEKDFQNIIDAIVDAYLGKQEKHYAFKTEKYKLMGILFENTKLVPLDELVGKIDNLKLNSVLSLIQKIRNGEVVDLKKYNLKIDNELLIQNERNRYKKGEITAEEILLNNVKYADVLCKEAYEDFVQKAPLSGIEKYKKFLTKEALYTVLVRVNADKFTLEISNATIFSFLEILKLDKKDYIKLSSVLSEGGMIPEQRIKLFEILSDEDDEIMDAYLFTLFDLEMLSPANAILDSSQPNEYQKLKAYRALKENNCNFSIHLFV